MDDKTTMENLLITAKGVCDLYMHGAIESGTANVRQTFSAALSDTMNMQDSVYQQMSGKGWYSQEQAESQKMQQIKQKFSAAC